MGFDGYQGISTTGGAHWLHLNRHSNDNVAIGLNSTANVYLVGGGGKVGIGTESPYRKLEVIGDTGKVRLRSTNSTSWTEYEALSSDGSLTVFGTSPGGIGIVGTNGDNDLWIRTNNSPKITVKSGGNVGIFKVTNGGEDLIFDGNEIYNNTTLHIGSKGSIIFRKVDSSAAVNNMIIKNDGRVGIGTTSPKNKLSVNGTIWATEVKIQLEDAADWVFDESYHLRPLNEVANYIKENKHLPEIPSAEEFRENDLKVSEITNKLLQKIEELMLYTIEQEFFLL